MSDYDAMTEREVMQLRVLRVAYHLEDACGPNGLLGPYIAEQADIVRGLLDDLHAVSDWLDAQPEVPEPDWTTAPDEVTHHAYLHDGRGAWLSLNPGDGYDSPGMWGARMMRFSGLRLPLGIDWRTTLRERPEA